MFRTLLTSSALALSLAGSAAADAPMAFDVAEDHTRIFMADTPVHENGMPAHGNAFISQGYIYPAGTLKADTTGVLDDGSPAFPDLVLGTWTCDGYFVGEGANATSGVWVISRQVFAFEDGDTIITQGTEIVDAGVENLRPITGATGDFAGIEGAMVQTMLGFSERMTVNVSFRLRDGTPDHADAAPPAADVAARDTAFDELDNGHPSLDEDDPLEWDSGFPVGPVFDESASPST
ncbi:MAG: hypothetical protein QNJ44_08560 [Rhodobacter sp.]|nr:hypothetical protein [Rhodobacter sp.]